VQLKGWSRQEAIAFLAKYSTSSSDSAATVIDRAIAVPGFRLPYSVGARHILDLRERAKQALGPRFDLREFHDRVLEYGAVPLPMLSEMIERWIASQR
jgi:uncharacterized protein (DUF885 family)